MNATQKARRVDALNVDHINRRELCVMIVNREADLEAVVDERDKLRDLVRDMYRKLLNAYDRKELDEYCERMDELKVRSGE